MERSSRKSELLERLANNGLDGFSDTDTAELLLYYSGYRSGVDKAARSIIEKFGSLREIFSADIPALMSAGLTMNAAVLIRMISEIYPSYSALHPGGVLRLTDTAALKEMFRRYFTGKISEEFHIAAFRSDLTLIEIRKFPEGSPSSVHLDLRKIIKFLLMPEIAVIAAAHNHPNSGCKPSREDRIITAKLIETADDLDVEFADHIIVGARSCYSFRENGDLPLF